MFEKLLDFALACVVAAVAIVSKTLTTFREMMEDYYTFFSTQMTNLVNKVVGAVR